MDTETNTDNKKQFQMAGALLIIGVVGAFYCLYLDYNKFAEWKSAKDAIVQKEAAVTEQENKIKALEDELRATQEKEQQLEKEQKPFYKPLMEGLDTEAIIAGEFTEILQLIRDSKIKVRSIKYDYNPQDDVFAANAPSKYNVARLNLEMISTYKNYDQFLKGLYKHDHFLAIESVEIVPYKKNKSILLIDLKLKLYSRK